MNQTGVWSDGRRRQARRKASFTAPYGTIRATLASGVADCQQPVLMPYLRYSRDERGYESTYVLHTYSGKRGAEPRLLYWFRTPPGARVGRRALDAAAMRAIESSNPDLVFDWETMLKDQPPLRPPDNRPGRSQSARKPRRPAPRAEKGAEATPAPAAAADAAAPEVEDLDVAPPAMHNEPWEHPVTALMGEEMLERLRARHAGVEERIAAAGVDEATAAAARERLAALDPDGWETTEDAVRGIETFEAETDAILALLG